MKTHLIALTILTCSVNSSFSETASAPKWVVINQVLSGDVPSISLLTEDGTNAGTTLVYETHGECEADVVERFGEFENFIAMNHPGFYHAAFTFDERIENNSVTRLLACVTLNM